MISYPHKFVFLKTHKTGGTSFEMLLEPWCTPPGHVVRERVPEMVTDYGIVGARLNRGPQKPYWRNHASAKQVVAHLGEAFWDEYKRIISVRNPYRRAISQFYWQTTWKKLTLPDSVDEQRVMFSDFVLSDSFKSDYYITHADGRYVATHMFRLEHRDEDIIKVGEALGIPLRPEDLPKTKENSDRKPDADFRTFFSKKEEDAVRDKQGWVFEHCGYDESSAAAF
nr:sulfotransferase family 2 domain-containing protein [Paracoccus suum]